MWFRCGYNVTTRISRFEEEKNEILSTYYTDARRKTNNVPGSDTFEAPTELEGKDSRKRGTSDVSQASSGLETSKKHIIFTDNKLQGLKQYDEPV